MLADARDTRGREPWVLYFVRGAPLRVLPSRASPCCATRWPRPRVSPLSRPSASFGGPSRASLSRYVRSQARSLRSFARLRSGPLARARGGLSVSSSLSLAPRLGSRNISRRGGKDLRWSNAQVTSQAMKESIRVNLTLLPKDFHTVKRLVERLRRAGVTPMTISTLMRQKALQKIESEFSQEAAPKKRLERSKGAK